MSENASERKFSIANHKDLKVFQKAMDLAMKIFAMTGRFPKSEEYALSDQVKRSSRSICANIGEAWRKRRYPAAFISKLNDAEAEACETQIWIELARRCGYITDADAAQMDDQCDHVIAQLSLMAKQPGKWTTHRSK